MSAMKRRQINYIKEWANRKTRKPLIIRGARQVGKTTLVRLACKEMGLTLIELNMEDPQGVFTTAISKRSTQGIPGHCFEQSLAFNRSAQTPLFL